MKWKSTGRGLRVLGISMAVGLGMTACSRDYVVGYLYATSATRTANGVINGYAIDYQTGALSNLPDSPIPLPNQSGDPVALVAAPNGQNIYVIVTNEHSEVDQYAVGTDGKLYGQHSYNVVSNAAGTIIGTSPTSISIDPQGRFLAVTFTYTNGFTAARPGVGGFAIFPINTDGTLGAAISNTTIGGATAANPLPYFITGNKPVSIFVSVKNASTSSNTCATAAGAAPSCFIYVADDDTNATTAAPAGMLLTYPFSVATGSTTPVLSAPTTVSAGSQPSSIAVDPTGSFIYVTDAQTNQLYAYATINNTPVALRSSPYPTGADPLNVIVDPRGEYVYVANFGSSTLSAYAISVATGSLSGAAAGAIATDTGPTCVTIEPALGIYVYTSNQIGNTVSGGQLNPSTGSVAGVQQSPFTAQALPRCVAAVANGAHATQIVN